MQPHSTIDTASSILNARKEFLAYGKLRQGAVTEVIARSWQRCLANGVDAHAPRAIDLLTAQELGRKREAHRLLLEHAQPEMQLLNEQIGHQRTIVVLTDASGTILDSLGGHQFLHRHERNALMPGASWHEDHRGTNAIGTALVEQSATSVWGAEHFMAHHHSFSCAAVPIFGATNELMAILDVSNDFSMPPQHTLALVKMAAQMIENRIFRASHASDIALHFHARPEFVGTLWQGIAMFSEDGRLLAANRSAQFQFDLHAAAGQVDVGISARQLYFDQLFDTPFSSLAAYQQPGNSVVFPLRLQDGGRLYAQVDRPHQASRQLAAAGTARRRSDAVNLDMLDSGDPQVARAIAQLKQVLTRDIPILIQGETGAGKELFARAIHAAGPRSDGPLVAVNCAALPEGLIEAELFGYEEGAFTGARRKGSVGKIAQADGGTLFLDEIGDMPLALQARLLRVLQERSVTPLGGTSSRAVSFSLVSATNRKLRELSERGEFRSDLYYRINGLSITLPPLRQRSDLGALIQILLQVEQAGAVELAPELMNVLQQHPWPGNIRQLHNVLRTALALAGNDAQGVLRLDMDCLTQDFLEDMPASSATALPVATCTAGDTGLDALAGLAIRSAMQQHAGNVSAAARQLGISRNTLYRKLRVLGLV